MALRYNVVGRTDVGLVRPGNEDTLHIDRESNVLAVCDGMGGHQAGEVASQSASQTIRTIFKHLHDELLADPDLALEQTLPSSGELLVKAIRLANREIHNRSTNDPALSGMGTTVVAVALEDNVMSVAHVGDSRAYRLEERQLVPLTTDHSWVAEMQSKQLMSSAEGLGSVGKNVITRALGVRENVEVDYRLVFVDPGDTFVLCSDGLCGFAEDDEIFATAEKAGGDLKRIVDDLIQMANDRGGADNVTVIAFRVEETSPSSFDELDVFTLDSENPELLAIEDTWLKQMANYRAETANDEQPSPVNDSPNKLLLTVIFAAFVILAAAIIYLTTQS
ncbi:MAG: protein phosphatase 2C domain-containing protein [candidate division Zixibacteria bacterium]|nr:protein phosphatase 2C domain-containing protein [candidate division Zixibacteria bacterium]MDH3938094.1 protein phosphatase 2C domain-containing protein [candidate division Zixibacteria bacterium]MDH4032244.1 protein phosphatase 2C domain-containing protein [candidate division Zixibacteria bacterium]